MTAKLFTSQEQHVNTYVVEFDFNILFVLQSYEIVNCRKHQFLFFLNIKGWQLFRDSLHMQSS